MNFTHHIQDGILEVYLKGDLLGANEFQDLLDLAEEQVANNVTKCFLDITEVNYMNSTGISLLIRLLTRFRNKKGEMVLVNPNSSIQKLLIITKLDNIFGNFANKEKAIDFLKTL